MDALPRHLRRLFFTRLRLREFHARAEGKERSPLRAEASPAPLFRKGDRNARGQGLAEFRNERSSRLDIATDNASGIMKANGERRFLLRGTLVSSSSSRIKRVRIIAAFTSPSSSSDHEGVGFVTRHADERSLHLQRACGRDATQRERERVR